MSADRGYLPDRRPLPPGAHNETIATVATADPLMDIIRTQLAPKASNAELEYFGQVCNQLDLSPFAGQIVLIGRWDSKANREVHRPQITVAGRRAIAARTGRLAGIHGPQWCAARVVNSDGEKLPLRWEDLWDDTDPYPYAARVLVYTKDCPEIPYNGTAKWSEFAQTKKDGSLLDMWQRMPSHMLGKVAESLALRRAFPEIAHIISDYEHGHPGDEEQQAIIEAAPELAPAADEPETGQPPAGQQDSDAARDVARDELLSHCGGDLERFNKLWPAFARSRGLEP